MTDMIETARQVLQIEAAGIGEVMEKLDHRFAELTEMICRSTGRVIIAGIGKSGLIGRKISATLNSTGTRSLFLHPVEAMHGDLGMVGSDDVFLALSNSGETDELNGLIPAIRTVGCPVAAFTGKEDSTLARHADLVINTGVFREACPMNLAPTASTTAQLAVGDALAVALMKKKSFQPVDFKKNHPGGALGQRLERQVADLMLRNHLPLLPPDEPGRSVIAEMDRAGLGVALIINKDRTLAGVVTDGDLRRRLAKGDTVSDKPAALLMTGNPKTVSPEAPAYDALLVMEHNEITVLPVTSASNRVLGVLHLHDILGKGSFSFGGY